MKWSHALLVVGLALMFTGREATAQFGVYLFWLTAAWIFASYVFREHPRPKSRPAQRA
ncbi:MAG: hypothetical protein WBR26_00780 [Candidatus Acidiferrum sp.]